MKNKITLLAAALLISMYANAQAFKFGTIAADAGVGLRLYGVRAYSPVNKTDVIGIFIGSTLPTVSAEFGLLKFLGVGVRYGRGAYLQQGFKVRTSDYSFCLNLHVANKNEKFDLPITIAYGYSAFKADQTTDSGTPQFIHANGGVVSLHISPHIYFGKYVGMFFRVGYNKTLYGNVEYNDGNHYYGQDAGGTWHMGGVEFCLGVCGRFNMIDKAKD